MTSIQEIYIALFGRPADPNGFSYWNGQFLAGKDLSPLVGKMMAQAEFKSLFSGTLDAGIVTTIYQNLFGRQPDAEGLAFYLSEITAGHATVGSIVFNIIDGAQGADAATLAAKVVAADLFTSHLDSAGDIAAYSGATAAAIGRGLLKTVDSTHATSTEAVDAAIATLPAGGSGAQFPAGGGDGLPDGRQHVLDAVITPHKIVDGMEQLLIGQGSADGFAISTDPVSHLELGISVRSGSGAVLSSSGYVEGHIAGFAAAGPSLLALSIASLGQTELKAFHFKLSVDTDPSAGISMQHYLLQGNADTGYLWALDANNDGIANGAGDATQQRLAIGQEQGHFMLLDLFALDTRSGLIDVRLEAFDGTGLLAQTAIRLDFDHAVPLVGLQQAAEFHG